MLRALRTSVMALAVRRSIAALLALCVCVAFAEPALADTCDDDARAAVTAAGNAATATDGRTNSITARAVLADASDLPSSSAPGPSGPVHALHVCHCTHAHTAPLSKRETLAIAPPVLPFVQMMTSDRTPPSVVQEPQLRPPRPLSVA